MQKEVKKGHYSNHKYTMTRTYLKLLNELFFLLWAIPILGNGGGFNMRESLQNIFKNQVICDKNKTMPAYWDIKLSQNVVFFKL